MIEGSVTELANFCISASSGMSFHVCLFSQSKTDCLEQCLKVVPRRGQLQQLWATLLRVDMIALKPHELAWLCQPQCLRASVMLRMGSTAGLCLSWTSLVLGSLHIPLPEHCNGQAQGPAGRLGRGPAPQRGPEPPATSTA